MSLPAPLSCTVKASSPSFRASPATVRVKVRLVSPGLNISVPLRSEASTKSATSVGFAPPSLSGLTVQVTAVAPEKSAPVLVTV